MLFWGKKRRNKDKQVDKRRSRRPFRRTVCMILAGSLLFGSVFVANPRPARAYCCGCCGPCTPVDVALTAILLVVLNVIWEDILEDDITYIINLEYEFLNEDFFEDFYIKGLTELSRYLSAYGIYQVEMVGSFFDARNQLESTRLLYRLQAEAHKDYQPSSVFCSIGTGARSLAASDSRSRLNMLAMSKISIDRQLGKKNVAGATDAAADKTARWHQFVDTFCDQKDNGWNGPGSGLERACDHDGADGAAVFGATDRSRINTDIDYTRMVDIQRTLDVDFTNTTVTDDEESILALSSNLYGSMVPARTVKYNQMKEFSAAHSLYLDQRAVVARRGVAQNSFNAIVSMKSAGTSNATAGAQTAAYLGAVFKEMMPAGTTDDDIFDILGTNPSYYAQLEVLSKKIYQNPSFFAKLYDTPANVARKSVAMKAIELMVDRALYESELRQEMLLSVMLSTQLDQNFRRVNKSMTGGSTE